MIFRFLIQAFKESYKESGVCCLHEKLEYWCQVRRKAEVLPVRQETQTLSVQLFTKVAVPLRALSTVPKGTLHHEDNFSKSLSFICQCVPSHGDLKPRLQHTQVVFQGQLLWEFIFVALNVL